MNQVLLIIATAVGRGVTMVGAAGRAITAIFHRAAVIKQKLDEPRPDRGAPRLRFWVILLWQTFRQRNILPLSREMADPYEVHGLEHLPETGIFSLAVNHTNRRWLPRLLASIHQATMEKRPDLGREWLVIVGYRQARLEGRAWYARRFILTLRGMFDRLWRRWNTNALRLQMAARDKDRVNIEALREWRQRARRQPTIVFPEGRAAPTFEDIRPGAGRWLAGLDAPVLTVAAWWEEDKSRWQIVFGPVVQWSKNPRLHDMQIGLEIAYSLPPEQAPDWQDDLAAWRQAHTPQQTEQPTPI